MSHTKTPRDLVVLSALAFVVSALLVAPTVCELEVLARDNDRQTESVSRVIPYRGTLTRDGTPLNGPVSMHIELVDEQGVMVWSDSYTSDSPNGAILVYAGEFKVMLGIGTPLGDLARDAEQLYVQIAVGDGQGSFIPLEGRQVLGMVPNSIWMASSTSFRVGNSIGIGTDVPLAEALVNVEGRPDRPDARFRQLTLDSGRANLGEVVAGAVWDEANGRYVYLSDRGATRISMDDTDEERFAVMISDDIPPGISAGDPVTWRTPLLLDGAGQMGVNTTTPTAKLDVAGELNATTIRTSGAASGTASQLGELELDASFLMSGSRPIFEGEISFDSAGSLNLDIPVADYFCFVAGFGQSSPVSSGIRGVQAFTKPVNGSWFAHLNQLDASGDEGKLHYVCIDRSLVQGLEDDAICGNQVCEFGEAAATCVADCSNACGNGTCSASENADNCAADCMWTL